MQRLEPGRHLREAGRQPLDLRGRLGCLALGVRGGALGVVFRRAGFELLLAGALRRFTRRCEGRLGRGELGERLLQSRGGAAPACLRLSDFLREGFELGAPLEGTPGGGSGQEHRTVGPSQRAPRPAVQHFVAREQRAHPRGRRAVHAQVVVQGMPVRREARSGHARQQHQRPGPRLLVPAANCFDGSGVAHQHGVQPLAQELLREHRVAPAGTHEVGQWPDHRVAELRPLLQQRLGRGGEPHTLALELGEGVAPRRHLRQCLLGLAPCGATVRLLLFELGHAPPRLLQAGRRLPRCARQRRCLLRPRVHLLRRRPLGLRAPGTLLGRVGELLAQLRPLPLERRPLAFERAGTLRPPLQVLFELAHRRAPRQQAVAPLLLECRAARQLLPDRREVALRRCALGGGRGPLALRLEGTRILLLAPLPRRGAPLAGIAQPLGRERQVALQPPRLELRIGQAALHFGATRLGRVSCLHARVPFPLRLLQPGPLAGQGRGQLLGPLTQPA